MTLRKAAKQWLYGRCPGFAGSFPYFGTRIYFPKGSRSFEAACEQGVFEADNVRMLQGLVRPDTWFFDVGTNIGLMSVPVLQHVPQARVLSFEPSPNVLVSLQRTIRESPHAGHWTLVPTAVGRTIGRVPFSLASRENSCFDGILNTGRAPIVRQAEVELTTVDIEWKRLGSPEVSAIKCDVEGGELDVLQGARECLYAARPFVLTEWNAQNLKAYDVPVCALFSFAQELDFHVFALPHIIEVRAERDLKLHMLQTESFLLAP